LILRSLLALAVVSLFSTVAAAEMYRWIDKNGVVTFKDTPPPVSKTKTKKVKVYTEDDFAAVPEQVDAPAPLRSARSSAPSPRAAKAKGTHFDGIVDIYVTSWCRYCKQAEKYLTSKGIPFVAYDIEKDRAANERHKNLGGDGVPLIIIGSHKMSGFSPQALEYYLNNSR
jgi:glutaredoxin-like YruB-family protein